MTNIGKIICARRKELGMTQEELAKKLGYKSKSTINKIENGTNDIPQSKVVKFAEVLETTIADLMGWKNPENIENMKIELFGKEGAAEVNELATILKRINKDEGFRNLMININKLNPDELENITVFVNALVQKKVL